MSAQTSPRPSRTSRRTAVIVGAAATLTLAGTALVAGAAAADATASPAPSTASYVGSSTMANVWAGAGAQARTTLCTSFQVDAAGTWNTLAPVLVEAGVTADDATSFLADACEPTASVADLRG